MDIMSIINDIPVIINNRNRLSTTKKLVEDLQKRNTSDIRIIDNASTYPPLLEWYDTLNNVEIIRAHNVGHLALFSLGIVNTIAHDWCFYTDADIELNENMPMNYQEIMLNLALKYNIDKIGLALNTSDLPDHYQLKNMVIGNEALWWLKEVESQVFEADTDTTFCLIKKVDQFNSLRIAGDFTCRHKPWYLNLNDLDEEEQYYLSHNDSTLVTQYTRAHQMSKEGKL